MRRLLAPALFFAACSAAPPKAVGNLEHDFFIPAASKIGHHDEALMGDGTDGRILLFLNFDGANILRVQNDVVSENSANNASWIPDTYSIGQTKAFAAFDTSPFVGFTDSSAKQFVVDHVTNWYTDFNVEVVSTRPTSGRYTMIMVGDKTADFLSSGSGGDGTVGVATLDCGNDSEINVGFDFAQTIASMNQIQSLADAQDSLLAVAQTSAHEAGHTFGLEHVNNVQDIMNPSVDPSVQGFLNNSNTLSGGTSSCDNKSTTENTHAVLLTNVGAAPTSSSVDMAKAPVDLGKPTTTMGDLSGVGGGIGDSCTSSADCVSGICATGDNVQFCTATCTTNAECPSDFVCTAVGSDKYCSTKKASGCDYGSGSPSSALAAMAALASFFLLRRRRSSRPSAT